MCNDWRDMVPEINKDELLNSICESLGCPDEDCYIQIIEDLKSREQAIVADILIDILKDPGANLALGAVKAIGELGCASLADRLVEIVYEPGKWFSHPERESIRIAAVESLGILKASQAVGPLIDLINKSNDIELQMVALRSLGQIASPESAVPLAQAMLANPSIATSAAGVLAEIGGEDAFQGLLCGLASDSEIIVSACIWALGKMGDEQAIENLVSLADKADPFVRQDITWSIGQIGGVKARLILGALCQFDTDIGVRREAAKAIQDGAVLGKFRNNQ
jgi:HEAT repeat protein